MDLAKTRTAVSAEVRVTKFGGQWKFQAKFRDEDEWTYYDLPLLEDFRELREVLFRKYQRRRAHSRMSPRLTNCCAISGL